MHFSTIAKVATLAHTKSHEAKTHDVKAPSEATSVSTALEAHEIVKITTIEEFEQILEHHHHRRVVVFCVTTSYRDPDVDEEGWYHHYERLNDVHFVRVDVDVSPPLEERLKPKTKPCWLTFYRGEETGWSSGGMKRFMQVHSERRHSH